MNHTTYYVTCQDKITNNIPTTNDWLTIEGILKKTNERDLNRVLKGIFEKHKEVAIKISNLETLNKEYIISDILKDIPGFLKFYCFFKCNDNFKEYNGSSKKALCKGPGDKMSVLVMPYLKEGSMRDFNWISHKPELLYSCLQQLMCSLLQAYESKGILHNDTHLDNILLKRTTKKYILYTINGRNISIPTNGYLINIMDFEMAFNEVPTNRGRAVSHVFEDILHAVYDLRFESKIEIQNDSVLISLLTKLKSHPIINFEIVSELLMAVTTITFSEKKPKVFTYNPYVVG